MLFSCVLICDSFALCQIGPLKKGLNPPSGTDLAFGSPYLTTAIKTGIVTGVIALAVSTLYFLPLTHWVQHVEVPSVRKLHFSRNAKQEL